MDLHFAEKCIIFVLAKRREPIDKGFSPLFSCENAPKNHCFTKHIEKFICRSGFSNCFCGNFSGQVGARIDDIGTWKVKRYLFSTLHFFHFGKLLRSFQNTSQCTARCFRLVSDMKDKLLCLQRETAHYGLIRRKWMSQRGLSAPLATPSPECFS